MKRAVSRWLADVVGELGQSASSSRPPFGLDAEKKREADIQRVRDALASLGYLARVETVKAAALTPEFAAGLNAKVAAFDGKPVTYEQVRGLVHEVLADMSVSRDDVSITLQWAPSKMRLAVDAHVDHRVVARVAADIGALPA